MKTVFSSNSEVAHIFAQRSQYEGRGSHFSFRGDTIYSYSTAMAQFHTHKKRGTVLLVNSRKYSVTTSSHTSMIRSACSQYDQFLVPEVSPIGHADNISYFTKEIEETAKKAMNAKKHAAWLGDEHKSLVSSGNRYIAFFGLKVKKFKVLLKSKDFQKKIEQQKTAQREATKREKQRQKELAAKWLIGEYNGNLNLSYQLLRLKDSKTVETSKGATFPLSHAVLALRKVRECVKNGTTWHRNGSEIRVGTFHIDSIDEKGTVKAGCHIVEYAEIERFASFHGL